MKPTRLVKTFEADESYYIKFMPDIENPHQFINEIRVCNKINPVLITKYISYMLKGDEVVPVTYSMTIFRALRSCLNGFIGTSDGFIIEDCENADRYTNMFKNDGTLLGYYSNNEKTEITLDKKYAEKNGLWFFDDVVEYEPRNPFDIKNALRLSFRTSHVNGYGMPLTKFGSMQWHEGTALWDGTESGKQKIKDLYANTPKIEDVIESEKAFLNRRGDCLFGEEAKKYYWDRKKQNA